MKAIWIGILSSLFFAVTFVLNRKMEMAGGSWLWSSSLRYFFMVPFLIGIVALRGGLGSMKKEMVEKPASFFLWSVVAFVFFYAPLTFSAAYGPAWLIASTWQLTIAAGVLLAPLFVTVIQTANGERVIRQRIPIISLGISLIILGGVIIIQIPNAQTVDLNTLMLGTLPILLAAFAYPLGNRKMMELLNGQLDMFQRVLGMTLMTLPVWVGFAVYAFFTVGPPSVNQIVQSLVVAVSSGVIATTLFFMATDLARKDQGMLAAVEATQSTELIFAMIGEILLLGIALPGPLSLLGMAIIMIGMVLHSLQTTIASKKRPSFAKQ